MAADRVLLLDIVERRVQIAFSVAPSKVQRFLPRLWEAASMPPGPSDGANLLIAFRNRLHTVYYDGVGRGVALKLLQGKLKIDGMMTNVATLNRVTRIFSVQ